MNEEVSTRLSAVARLMDVGLRGAVPLDTVIDGGIRLLEIAKSHLNEAQAVPA